jgi:DNA-directed RNA polymerase alpha subunit
MTSNWLSKLIIETGLFNHSLLNEKEIYVIQAHVGDEKAFNGIAEELDLSSERVRQIFENGLGKILINIRDFELRMTRMNELIKENDMLKSEIAILKKRFKKELATDKQIPLNFESSKIPLSEMPFSVRAFNALKGLNINTLGELATKSKEELYAQQNVGVKTIQEIINRAEEYGVKIE